MTPEARIPEYGPRILFFTGGSGLKETSRHLKTLTHNTVHVMTAFDSGGSSARLRRHFRMPSIGDVRSRLLALADERLHGHAEIFRIFAHRLPVDAEPEALRRELEEIASGRHPALAPVPEPLRHLVRTHIATFRERMPEAFDLRNASVGNLVLTGGHLQQGADLGAVTQLFSKLLGVLGRVELVTLDDVHLAATLEDGTQLVGQHRITKMRDGPAIASLSLVDDLDDPKPVEVDANPEVLARIADAEVICFPVGSFWTSVVASLLPEGVGEAVRSSRARKVYVPNPGEDPEERGMSRQDALDVLRRHAAVDTVLDDARLVRPDGRVDPVSLSEALLALV